MIDTNLKLHTKDNTVKELLSYVRQGIPSAAFGVPETFKNYIVSVMDSPVLYVVKDGITAQQSVREIQEFSDKKAVYIPAKDETLLNIKAFSKDNAYQRIMALDQLPTASVIVVTPQSLTQLAPKTLLSLEFKKDQDYVLSKVVKNLVKMGYERRETCVGKGVFSLRGDVLDLFPINSENPVRLDFFGDTLESIREFDLESTKTIGFIDQIRVCQAVEFLFDDQAKKHCEQILNDQLKQTVGDKRLRLKLIYDDLILAMENDDQDGLSVLSPLLENAVSVLEVIDKNSVIAINDGKRVYETCELLQKEFRERFKSLLLEGEVFSFAERNFIPLETVKSKMLSFREVGLQTLSSVNPFFNPLKIVNPAVSSVTNYQFSFTEVFTDVDNWLKSKYSILLCTGTAKRAEQLSLDFSARGIASSIDKKGEFSGVNIVTQTLSNGFVFHEQKLAVIGSGNLYAKPKEKRSIKSAKQTFFSAPEVGDYCVHETHGVGRVLGNKKITTSEGTKDYVCVEYAGGDLLYVPVENMDMLTRYLGSDKTPRLSKIGGKDFERVKNAVKESIKKMSFDLKQLYQDRESEKGYQFIHDQELQQVFDSAFPFELTEDQRVANAEILEDMTSNKVMDRLVCGDVGFGKTEVAFRAVFRAVANGKQVAMVAPTTILTEQHYSTAVDRFKGFGIKIACLNRFKTPKQQTQIIQGLKDGKIDFVIGTHRLFSKDVEFKDLGLLVLDEEQRFGVEHKEKIKLLKKNVDALTLTATPIPRTLHMSLSGIRSISTINTPPKKRLPVQTYVTEETESLIKDALTREVNRGGQAFVLYNRVESIFSFAERVQALMPNLKITVAHGQMDERSLERNILTFYKGESDVLISTTIIENGIDLPKANTLVVIDADNLGLSTLYQIKGRVGRSDRLAYAYFTYKRDKILTTNAFERLNAIMEFAEMGSGIKIAMRDLEIRGAGNILGAEQHGHMEKIGYELYSKLLKEELSGEQDLVPELDMRVNAYIPSEYVENSTVRMDIYKEIAEITNGAEEEKLVEGLEQTFGEVPREVLNLLDISIVKRLAGKIRVSKINVQTAEVSLVFEDFEALNNSKLMTALDCFGRRAKLTMTGKAKIEFEKDYNSNEQMLGVVREFLNLAST